MKVMVRPAEGCATKVSMRTVEFKKLAVFALRGGRRRPVFAAVQKRAADIFSSGDFSAPFSAISAGWSG